MARDKYHYLVKKALAAEGWTVTDDPFIVDALVRNLEIDLGAERLLAAQKGKEKIAIEIKTFSGISQLHDYYKALGQFNYYSVALRKQEPDRVLYLAVPDGTYKSFFKEPITAETIQLFNVKIIVYSIQNQKITQWIK